MAGTRRVRESRCALALAIALLAALATGCGGSSQSEPPRSFYGVDLFGTLDAHDWDRMEAAGVGSLRFLIQWPDVQPSAGAPFDFATTDAVVAEAARHRMTILPALSDVPSFAIPPSCQDIHCGIRVPVASSAQRTGWKRFARAAVRRYGPGGSFWREHPEIPAKPATHWEIWNEQNNPAQGNPARRYAKLLALSHAAITSVDPSAQIVVGGMFGTPLGSQRPGVTAWSYLRELYKYGVGDDFDAVALHPYAPTVAGIAYQVRRVRSVLSSNGDPTKPLFLTELGWSSGAGRRAPGTGARGQVFVVTAREQKQRLESAYRTLTRRRTRWHIGGVYWFGWKDPLDPPPGLCAFCYAPGLYEADGSTPKPALAAFESFTRRTVTG